MFSLRPACWNLLNSAHIVLIEKKEGVESIGVYRRISIMHSTAKPLAKILANRLAPKLDKLISHSQSAFIKGRSIQDNFQYIKGAANHFHQAKTPMLMLKLDIAKAFDNVRWEYLLEVMQHLGFGQRWQDLMALIWSTTTSRILLNGAPGRPIKHARGLHQGDPLSPILFILAIDPLQRMLDMATQQGLLTPIGADPIKFRTSLYANDAMLFLRPIASDVSNLQRLLHQFGVATRLCTNIQKSEIFPIRCEGIDIPAVLGQFQVQLGSLPCKYLGLPLRIGRVKREDEQVLIDKVAGKLPKWKGKLLNKTGRLTLVNSVLSAAVNYHMTAFPLSKWAMRKIDKIRRNFLWQGSEEARWEHCMVNWRRVQCPKKMGGLGILDLSRFNTALRLQWQWYKWKDCNKPWATMHIATTDMEEALFCACTSITVGNGESISFWHNRWLAGQSPKKIAPNLFRLAAQKNLTVAQGCRNHTWMRGLQRIENSEEINKFVQLWHMIGNIQLSDQIDTIAWRFTANGEYTAKSAYAAQFAGSFTDYEWNRVWHAKVENKCRFFCWLVLQNKIWTANRITKREGTPNTICQLCYTHPKSVLHMLVQCPYSKSDLGGRYHLGLALILQLPPANTYRCFQTWWSNMTVARVQGAHGAQEAIARIQKMIYTVWNIWKEQSQSL
jgi:hypothetical protein